MEIWQSGFHEATSRDAADYLSKIRYIHQNPAAAGLALTPDDWAWSSASARDFLDPIPQGRFAPWAEAQLLQSLVFVDPYVGAEAPTS